MKTSYFFTDFKRKTTLKSNRQHIFSQKKGTNRVLFKILPVFLLFILGAALFQFLSGAANSNTHLSTESSHATQKISTENMLTGTDSTPSVSRITQAGTFAQQQVGTTQDEALFFLSVHDLNQQSAPEISQALINKNNQLHVDTIPLAQTDQSDRISPTIKDKTVLLPVTQKTAQPMVNHRLHPNKEAQNTDRNNMHASGALLAAIQQLPAHGKTRELKKQMEPKARVAKKTSYTIRAGDNLALIFKKNHIDKRILHQLVHQTKHGKQLARIRPGQKIEFDLNEAQQPVRIVWQKNRLESLTFEFDPQQKHYISSLLQRQVDIQQNFVNVIITDSLFASARRAGLSEKFTMRLAHLFGWDIDFALDIRKGDSFSVLYNEHYLDGKKIGNGKILAAEFVNQNKVYQSIYYTDASGKGDYYDARGYSKRRAFLRTPVAFTRISSRFSSGRKHPILNRIRAHHGVDYAAPKGTPIKATGDGKIVFKGRKGGYGRVIQIQHGSKYMTVYAHMSAYNRKLHKGSRVRQGQVIGYVGMSGLATGPHLHYEFRVNGVHRNPLTVKLPKASPINPKYRKDFLVYSENMLSRLKSQKQRFVALNHD